MDLTVVKTNNNLKKRLASYQKKCQDKQTKMNLNNKNIYIFNFVI